MDDVFAKFRHKFIEEALNFTYSIEKCLLDLEKKTTDISLIQEIFRIMHTLKGVSSMYGFNAITEITHKLENIYEIIRDQKIPLSRQMADITLKAADHIKKLLDDEKLDNKENKENHQLLLWDIEKLSKIISIPIESQILKEKALENKKNKLSTYYIMLLPDETFVTRGIKIADLLRELSFLGRFQIMKHQFSGFPGLEKANENAWGIYLSTNATLNQIADVFIFVEENVKIVKISKNDIFDQDLLEDNEEQKNDESDSIGLEDDEDGAFGFFVSEIKKIDTNSETEKKQEGINFTKQEFEIELPQEIVIDKLNTISSNQTSAIPTSTTKISRISVESEKLDQLMFLVSELVTTNAQLGLANKNKNKLQMDSAVEKIEKLAKKFRDNAINLRLIPIDDIVIRFQRLIRDLSRSLNKEINFVTEGTDTELDKNVIDMLVEPLMHIIRNCIDHGIETPDVRVRKKKISEGTIKFSSFYSGTYVYITISDDGKGVDTNLILKKAIEKGFVAADTRLNKKEILDLIFLPGFSTAESLTQVSGRGVGMDVVKRKISELRGDVLVDSEIDKGTTFTIKLQQTVSIIDALLVKSEKTHFMIPLSEVLVCDIQKHTEIFKNENKQIIFNAELIPFIHLRQEFELGDNFPKEEKIIIISRNDRRIAIVVDTIVGEYQAVIKPLGNMFKKQDFISGASILGDGSLAVMLDSSKLSEKVFN